MAPVGFVVLAWVLFGGTHLGLAALHERGVARLGPMPFTALYSAIAAVTFALLAATLALHRGEGPPGLALGTVPVAHAVLEGLAGLGVALLWTGLVAYPRLPTALFGQPLVAPRGIERITRHPTFAGFALWGLAHALLAPTLAGTTWFGGFVVFTAVGAWHQDRRALATRGPAYAEYLAATSFVPFARGLPDPRDLPFVAIGTGVAFAVALRLGHAHLLDHGGAWFAGAVIVGGTVAGALALGRSRASRGT